MTVLEWIDYGFIVLFFAIMGALLIFIAGPRRAKEAAREKPSPARQNMAAYVVLAVLFLFFLSLTVLSNRRSGS